MDLTSLLPTDLTLSSIRERKAGRKGERKSRESLSKFFLLFSPSFDISAYLHFKLTYRNGYSCLGLFSRQNTHLHEERDLRGEGEVSAGREGFFFFSFASVLC